MKNIILFLLLFCSIGLSAQIRPDQQPEKTPEGTDAIYTQENGQIRKVLFDSAFYYFIPRINTNTLGYSLDTESATNPDSLRGKFVKDDTEIWHYVDSSGLAFPLGQGYLTNSSIRDSIPFDTTYTLDPQRGTLIWNNDDETLDLGINGVVLQIGQEMLAHIKNQTGSTIENGTVVRYSGSVGASGRMNGDLMIADGTYPAYHTIGVTTEDIPNGEDGFVTVFGVVGGINTTAYSAGDILYVSTTVEGALTDTVPEAPNPKIPIAVVLNSGNDGSIFVRPTILPALNDIADVEITSPVDNSILKYDSTAGTWIDAAYPTILSEAEVSAIVSDTADVLRTYTDQAEQDAKDYADANDDSGTDDQTLSFSNPNLSIENGNSVNISSISNWTIDGTNIYSDLSNSLDSATFSFAAGADAGSNRNTNYQIAIGRNAGQQNTGDYQNAFGFRAGEDNTGAYQNAFGREAGEGNTGIYQNAFGRLAGQQNTGGYQNAIGFQAGQQNTGAYQNAFGNLAGEDNTGPYQNAFGREAGEDNVGTDQNAFGRLAGENNTGDYQNAFGFQAGQQNTGAEQNAFGRQAGRFNQGDHNISIGRESGYSVQRTLSNPGDYNTWLNYRAGYSITEGNDNIGIGREAGDIITDGEYNIYIGGFASASDSSAINEIAIGYNVTGNGDNTVTIGNSSITDNYFTGDMNISGGGITVNGLIDANGGIDITNGDAISIVGTDYIDQQVDGLSADTRILQGFGAVQISRNSTGNPFTPSEYIYMNHDTLSIKHTNKINIDAPVINVNGEKMRTGGPQQVTSSSTAMSINLGSVRSQVVQIDMTSASTASPITVTISNPISNGNYTFHFQNVNAAGHDLNLPANVLNAAGTAFDGSTTITYTEDDYFTCYYDGTNFYCK